MSENIIYNPENNDFQANLKSITDRRLTPENLETYANGALNDLVEMVDRMVVSYNRQPTIRASNSRESELSSFAYFNLESDTVEQTLDHIADVVGQIDDLEFVLQHPTERIKGVILPSGDLPGIQPKSGQEPYREPQTIQRTKTLAFILKNRFEIDLQDTNQFILSVGDVEERAMRRQSYSIVEVPALNRLVFVCDEEGNATFVFDTSRFEDEGLDTQSLARMTKKQLQETLNTHEKIGQRLPYSKLFVERIISLLEEIPSSNVEEAVDISSSQFLKPAIELPRDFSTINMMATEWDVSPRTVTLAVEVLEESLAPIDVRRVRRGKGYSVIDKQTIYDYLEQKGSFTRRPEADELSRFGMSKTFDIPREVINVAIDELGDTLGEVQSAKFGSIAEAYKPDQQQMVYQWVKDNYIRDKNGAWIRSSDERLKDLSVVSEIDLARHLSTTRYIIRKIRLDLDEELGTNDVESQGRHALIPLFMQERIAQKVEEYKQQEVHNLLPPPDGYESRMDMTRRLGVHQKTITRAIEATQDQLGEVLQALFSNNPSPAYSPVQQKKIEDWLAKNMKRQTNSKFGKVLIEANKNTMTMS